MPRVAVIMRSKDEQPYAELALRALRAQTWRDFVLYNVDSGSTDGTLEVVREFNDEAARIVEIAPQDYVPGRVLNDMIERAREEVIVLLNADAVPADQRWLERLLSPILAGEADATMSRQVARPTARFVVQYDYERAYSAASTSADFYSAVACAFRRELWEKTRFYTEGYAEDLAWFKACQDQGARFRLVPEAVVEHSHDYSLAALYRKRFRHGVANVYVYGQSPPAGHQVLLWARESARDLVHALRSLRPDTIPYNLLYRATIYLGFLRGGREGKRRFTGARL